MTNSLSLATGAPAAGPAIDDQKAKSRSPDGVGNPWQPFALMAQGRDFNNPKGIQWDQQESQRSASRQAV